MKQYYKAHDSAWLGTIVGSVIIPTQSQKSSFIFRSLSDIKEWSQAAIQTHFSLYRGQPFKAVLNIARWYYEAI